MKFDHEANAIALGEGKTNKFQNNIVIMMLIYDIYILIMNNYMLKSQNR